MASIITQRSAFGKINFGAVCPFVMGRRAVAPAPADPRHAWELFEQTKPASREAAKTRNRVFLRVFA